MKYLPLFLALVVVGCSSPTESLIPGVDAVGANVVQEDGYHHITAYADLTGAGSYLLRVECGDGYEDSTQSEMMDCPDHYRILWEFNLGDTHGDSFEISAYHCNDEGHYWGTLP